MLAFTRMNAQCGGYLVRESQRVGGQRWRLEGLATARPLKAARGCLVLAELRGDARDQVDRDWFAGRVRQEPDIADEVPLGHRARGSLQAETLFADGQNKHLTVR